jgi:4-oxalocrotonate tautomerase
MPFIDVKLFEERLTPETEQQLIVQLTEAVADVLGEQVRNVTWVVLEGTPAKRWGVGGKLGEAK